MGDARREMDRREQWTVTGIRIVIIAAILFIIMAVRYATHA